MERHKQLVFVLSYLVLLSAVFASSPCDPTLLARMADSCGWDLGKPSETCCQMVVAAVGIGYGDPVPCICLVVEDPDFPATRLNINMILEMYPICDGVLPVGPHIAAVCRGLVFSVLFFFCFYCSPAGLSNSYLRKIFLFRNQLKRLHRNVKFASSRGMVDVLLKRTVRSLRRK